MMRDDEGGEIGKALHIANYTLNDSVAFEQARNVAISIIDDVNLQSEVDFNVLILGLFIVIASLMSMWDLDNGKYH
jgi:hypothetical protein